MNNLINLTSTSNLNRNNNNNNSIRNMLESNLDNEFTFNISSYETHVNQIEMLKNEIQYGNIINMPEITVIDIIHTIISNKDASNEYEKMYVNFMNFLEFHDRQYTDKFNDLLNYILESMSEEEKQSQYKDSDGNPILLSKPRLERSYNNHFIINEIKGDDLYKLTMAVIRKIKNIRQYEQDYCTNKPSTLSH